MESFIQSDISSTYLDNIQSDFNNIRIAGLKCIVRFAYSNNQNNVGSIDANKAQILAHIAQLKPVLQANSDVILVVQAGFIGTWGEWYFTDHFGYPNPTATDFQNRKEVLEALLAALPSSRMVQIRRPHLKQTLYSRTTAITESEAFNGTNVARIGHHNDCFLSSEDDFGTYIDQAKEFPYLEQETQFLPIGGETRAQAVTGESSTSRRNVNWSRWVCLGPMMIPNGIQCLSS
jgi:hypothetical protein